MVPHYTNKIFVQKAHEEKLSDTAFNPQSYELTDNRALERVITVCRLLDLSFACKGMELNKH